jgi:hypothetical protein
MSFMNKSSGDEHTIGGPNLAEPAAATLKQIQERLLMGWKPTASFVMAGLRPGHPRLFSRINSGQDVDARHRRQIYAVCARQTATAGHDGIQSRSFVSNTSRSYPMPSPHPGPTAALAFHHLVALLEQALAFAILALRLLLDVGASFIGHDSLPAVISCTPTKAAFSAISKAYSK